MKTLKIAIDETTFNKLEIISKQKKLSKEETLEILLKEKIEEELLKKAEEIIEKEKSLLKRLA